ncbi:hypothetical protein P8C59_007420 [Phyllachora maydis]|uniref:Uncharacterized protein n=1 Tax=Phyllachora maydis TaxID=1825666 RepID=A0AAD9I8C7_9PEZI|nr:hypothetical protein P8C59_007420 [Phyllachora maydis]
MELRHSPGRISDDYHAINVERTLKELRRMVSEHEYALNQLRDDAVNIQFPDPQRSTKASLDATTEALKRLTKSEPFLPFQNSFIAKYLGSMLAAEELGGPVVGDMMEIDPDGLEAGFNAQGKPKRAKVSDADSNTRQRRLDQIWGTEGGDQTRPGSKKRDRDESVAAGAEMRNLVEDLLNSLVQSGGDTSAAYVKISRESAAVRFLVRSKVAQFHPKDATRLRLIDFGRELDD